MILAHSILVRASRPTPEHRRAFTLVEVISTLTVMAIIGGIASRIAFQSFAAMNDASIRFGLHDQLAAAMERIAIELRTISVQPGSNPVAPDINGATTNSLSFNAGSSPRTLAQDGSVLRLTGQAGVDTPLATSISSFVVQCYNGANAPLPSAPSPGQLAAVRRIQITLVASSGGVSETLRTKVFIRSMAAGSGAP